MIIHYICVWCCTVYGHAEVMLKCHVPSLCTRSMVVSLRALAASFTSGGSTAGKSSVRSGEDSNIETDDHTLWSSIYYI